MVESFFSILGNGGTRKVHTGQKRSNMLYYNHPKGIERVMRMKEVKTMLEKMLKAFYEFQVLYIH